MPEKPRYQTFVFKGELSQDFLQSTLPNGTQMTSWAEGHALEKKDQLEDFIRSLAFGDIESPEEAAQELMDEMGWS